MKRPDPCPRYHLTATLGEGAYGAVYRAYDRTLGREVALKVALPQPDDPDPQMQKARFLAEARVLEGLWHPGVCAVLDAFFLGGESWLALELIPGESLEERVQTAGPMGIEELVSIMRGSLEALVHLHSHQPPVVHRDLKPANLRLTPDGRTVLVDFGLARPRGRGDRDTEVIGTPGYAAPEQYLGHSQPASDLFAWACTMFYAATKRPPVQGPAPFPALTSLRPDLPSWLEQILSTCTQATPEQRPQACEVLGWVQQRHLGPTPARGGAAVTRMEPGPCPFCSSKESAVHGYCPACLLATDLAGAPAAAFLDRAERLLRSQRPEAALAHVEQACAIGSQDDRIPILKGQALLAAGDPEGALVALQPSASLVEGRPELARAYLRMNRATEADAQLQGLAGPRAELLRIQLLPEPHRLKAVQAARNRHPLDLGLLRMEAHLLAANGRCEEALALLTEGLRQDREDPGLLAQTVQLLHSLGRHSESLIHLRTWARALPDHPEPYLLMAREHARHGRTAEARRGYLEYLQLRPEQHTVRLELARFLLNQSGRPDEALQHLERLLRVPTCKSMVTPFYGLALIRVGRYSQAEQVLRPIVAGSSKPEWLAHYAEALAQLGRKAEALEWAHRALQIDPGCATALELVGGTPPA